MLTNNVVDTAIDLMCTNYGTRKTPKMKIDTRLLLVRSLSNYDDKQFAEAIDKVLDDERVRTFPTTTTIKAYLPSRARTEWQGCGKCAGGVSLSNALWPCTDCMALDNSDVFLAYCRAYLYTPCQVKCKRWKRILADGGPEIIPAITLKSKDSLKRSKGQKPKRVDFKRAILASNRV